MRTNIKRSVSVVMIISLLIALSSGLAGINSAYAASRKTKSMTKYDQIIVKGKVAYCTDSYCIYKVNLKNGKVKKLIKPINGGINGMKLYKGYIFYEYWGGGTGNTICKVKTNGKARKKLVSQNGSNTYVLSKSKIYYETYTGWNMDKRRLKVANLDGKAKNKSNFKVKNKTKDANKKNYYINTKESSNFDAWDGKGSVTTYLEKPNGKQIKLAHYTGKYLRSR